MTPGANWPSSTWQPNLTLLEVVYLLGFADPSNFVRAFRRRFAITPGEYRACL